MELGLKDRVAVVTGGSVGLGLAVAEGLALEGVHLARRVRQFGPHVAKRSITPCSSRQVHPFRIQSKLRGQDGRIGTCLRVRPVAVICVARE